MALVPSTDGASSAVPRWELYRLLADPVRVRLLALTSAEELSVGELSDLLRESQPKVSRHATALRDAGLVASRKQGTWVLLRIKPGAESDPVVRDAISAGRVSCQRDGTWEMVDRVIAQRDAKAREFFARGGRPISEGPPSELGAYLFALRALVPNRRLAIDAGTGDGALLDVLSPLFERVIAIDRSEPQLDLARERARQRGLANVDFIVGEIDGEATRAAVRAIDPRGADVVFAARVLHHAAQPARALASLVDLARAPTSKARGGHVIVLDYASHHDEELRDAQADLWLGFDGAELTALARTAGLGGVTTTMVPEGMKGDGPDRHLEWMLLSAHREREAEQETTHE